MISIECVYKSTFGLSFVRRLFSFRGDFSIECVYKSTFGLSFVGRFVLFRSVLYQRFYCSPIVASASTDLVVVAVDEVYGKFLGHSHSSLLSSRHDEPPASQEGPSLLHYTTRNLERQMQQNKVDL